MSEPLDNRSCILVVEDDEHIGPLLVFMLERHGYRVQACSDGRQARQFIETATNAPQLVLLDVMLPFHDGFELLAIIRARPGWQALPVLMLTAKASTTDIDRARALGANDYIQKPFQPDELLTRLYGFIGPAV